MSGTQTKADQRTESHDRDKQEMQRLHTLGMTEDDSFKLLAMRGYIMSVAIARRRYAFAAHFGYTLKL